MRNIPAFVIPTALLFLASACCRADFTIVRGGKARAVIVLGTNASITDRHAAAELTVYVKRMTGAKLRTVTTAGLRKEGGAPLILVGRPDTNILVRQLADSGRVTLSANNPGLDGYIIRTVRENSGRRVLVLGGSRDRGTLYAVYDLLARFARVGFFWDAERIPRLKDFTVPSVSIAERPFFKDRLTLGHMSVYTIARAKTFEDWRLVIDWAAKNRFNQVLLYGTWPPTPQLFWRRVRARMGIEPEPKPTALEEAEAGLYGDILRYMRRLDLDAVPHVLPGTSVDAGFHGAFPNAGYFKATWSNVRAPEYHISPLDPIYRRYVKTCVRTWREMYPESGHLYFGAGAFPEQVFVDVSRKEMDEILVAFPKAVDEALREADPQGIWENSGWNFLDSSMWTQEIMHAFFANIKGNSTVVWDLACDERPMYLSKQGNYWYGKPWLFGVIHSYGGNDYLHGNLADTLKRARRLVDDPKAANCVGFAMTTEIMGYCILYYDFLCRVGWDPRDLTVDNYLKDFATRRYGSQAGSRLLPSLRGLAKTVHGPGGGSTGLYQTRPHLMNLQGFLGGVLPPTEVEATAKSLRDTLDALLGENKVLAGDTAYLNDIVDYARQYITEAFNFHRVLLDRAFLAGDRTAFETEAQTLDRLLDHLRDVVATRWDYRLADIYDHQAAAPFGDRDGGRKLRDELTTYAVCVPKIIDYASNDLYEMVDFYYRPRLDAYISYLRERLDAGERTASQSELDELYRPIEVRWVENGFDPAKTRKAQDPTIDICRKAIDGAGSALEAVAGSAASLPPPKGLEDTTNIAAGRCVEASSIYGSSYSLSSVADGDVFWGQGWASAGGESENQWLSFDFATPRSIAAVQYFVEPIPAGAQGKRYCREYRIEVSDDGKSWNAVASGAFPPDVTQFGASLPLIPIVPQVKARYLRFNMLSSHSKDVICVGELAIWGR